MKYYLIAGEASGDLHASNLMQALSRIDPHAEFRCWGGDRMSAVPSTTLVHHYREIAFMGFWEVLTHLPLILNKISFCKEDILAWNPDVVIPVDYPGFNLRLLPFLHRHGFRCFYYISPQLWAWNKGRVKSIAKFVERMFVILPFETDFYAQYQIPVSYHGHPLLDAIEKKAYQSTNFIKTKPILALLPGSRKQEIQRILPVMIEAALQLPQYHPVIAGLSVIGEDFYRRYAPMSIELKMNQTYDLLSYSDLAMVTSGTATLETAMFQVPQVVVYKGNPISYIIGKQLVQVPFISLVNLILSRPSVKELIQGKCRVEDIVGALTTLEIPAKRDKLMADYQALKEILGDSGASERIAAEMYHRLTSLKD